ncbi:OB-fold protein [Succinimonas amylolytica]|uniref:OB-fold protein n=1 Tax=Succinimonas amylolytica TaxID=83769 RepID=UPI000365C195|nr:hypothetical protein [Succinimonas amylolytica]
MKKTLRFIIIAILAAFSFNSEAKNLSQYISLLRPNDISNIDKTVIENDDLEKRKAFIKKMVTFVLEDDYNMLLNNGDVLLSEYIKDTTNAQQVTVETVYNTYKKNQIKGDREYLNKPLLLIGVIEKIKSSVGNTPVLYLKTGKKFTFDSAHVFFKSPDDDIDSIVELEKGQKVAFLCIGGGVVIDSLVFNQCEFANVYKDKLQERLLLDVDSYFNDFKISKLMFFLTTAFYATSVNYPKYYNQCNIDKCKFENKYLAGSMDYVKNIFETERYEKLSEKEKTKLEKLKVDLWRLLITNKIVDSNSGKLLIDDYEMKNDPW